MKIVNFTWKWSWVVTLPLVCIFLYWGWGTLDRFYTFGVRYNPRPISISLLDTGRNELYSMYRHFDLSISEPWWKKSRLVSDLKVINLYVPESGLAKLNSNLPNSGFDYVKGAILNGNKLQKMKFRYRGDFVYHWGEKKKSLRVKTSKKKLYNGVRTFNLLATKQLSTHFGCLLARELGLIAPRTDLVEVIVNGHLRGTHVYVEQLEELTLRDNRLMPGDIYGGELLAKDAYWGLSDQVFDYPLLWKKLAVNNHYPAESRKPLEKLLSLLKEPDSVKAHKELVELIDVQAWGKMAAYETLAHSFHYDNTHNWRLYYDPMRSRFYPVIWDPAAWLWGMRQGQSAQLDIMPSVLHSFLFQNGDVLRARSQALAEFFNNRSDLVVLQQFNDSLPGLENAIRRDPLLTTSTQKAIYNIYAFRNRIEEVFHDVEKGYFSGEKPLKYKLLPSDSGFRVALAVNNRAPVQRVSLFFTNKVVGSVTGMIRYQVNGKVIDRDISGAISQNGSTIEVETGLIADHLRVVEGDSNLQKTRLAIEPGYYELTITDLPQSNELIDLRVYSAVGSVPTERVNTLLASSFTDLYNIVGPQPIELPLVWQNNIDISGVLKVDRPLVIKPGTVVRFAPGASLIVTDRFLAEGTASEPICFISAESDQKPWGTVVLRGDKAKGSRLKYCQFVGGSGLKGDLFEYTAMFSIHDVQGVTVENCIFKDSQITDDMVHAVYSNVKFIDCRFEDSLMDALDIDISNTLIKRCEFIDSGNDAIDLMTSTAVVLDTVVKNSVDKAASVGEGSFLLAINNIFNHNGIGVQAKDGSVAALYNMDFIDNKHAIDAYKKNWRYNNGGKIYLYKSRVSSGSQRVLTADKKSRIRVYDSYLDPLQVPRKKRIKFADTVDNDRWSTAKNNKLVRNKRELEFMKEFDTDYFILIDPARRGALLNVCD